MMKQKDYMVIGSIFLGALIIGLIFGWGVGVIGDGLSTTKVVEVSENPTPNAGSANKVKASDNLETIIYYRGILQKEPDNLDATIKLADFYFGMHNYNDAIKYYKKAVGLAPNDASFYNNLGLSYHYLGLSQQGLQILEDGIRAAPHHQRIWLTKGFVLATTGRVTEAIEAWDRAYALNSESEVGKAALEFLNQYRPMSSLEKMQRESINP
jgi:tetratricopeptide (TPR) repeat protein